MLVESDFQTTGPSLDENRAILYAPERLRDRLARFRALCLPPLIAQSDPDFTLIVATGEDLPPWALGELRAAIAPLKQARLIQAAPGRHAPICKAMLTGATEPGADLVAQFCMDDDDAVATDFIARSRAIARANAGLIDGDRPFAINHVRGLALEAHRGHAVLTEELARLWVPSLVMVFPGGRPRSIQNYRHDWLWRNVPVLSFPDPVMWLRSFHDHNDAPRPRRILAGSRGAEPEQILRRRFGLDAVRLAQALGLRH